MADKKLETALEYRAQALLLLQKANELDSLQPYIVAHDHRIGASCFVVWANKMPDEPDLTSILDRPFEPEQGETVHIDSLTLGDMSGISVSSRLPDENDNPNNEMASRL